MKNFAGDFESHVTVEALPPDQVKKFQDACLEIGVKPILIELSRGDTPVHPMTAGKHRGRLPDVIEYLENDVAAHLRHRGFKVSRIKVEAAPWNEEIPLTNTEAEQCPDNYFEFHLKVLLDSMERYDELAGICEQHVTHLSSNAFKKREDGKLEYFTTMRCYNMGRTVAQVEFTGLAPAIKMAGFETCSEVCEYTVYDTNLSLDDAWLEA